MPPNLVSSVPGPGKVSEIPQTPLRPSRSRNDFPVLETCSAIIIIPLRHDESLNYWFNRTCALIIPVVVAPTHPGPCPRLVINQLAPQSHKLVFPIFVQKFNLPINLDLLPVRIAYLFLHSEWLINLQVSVDVCEESYNLILVTVSSHVIKLCSLLVSFSLCFVHSLQTRLVVINL